MTSERVAAFWREYLDTIPAGHTHRRARPAVFALGDSPSLADALAALVAAGPPSLPIRLRSPQVRRGKPPRLTRVAGSRPRVSCLPPDVARRVQAGVVALPAAPDHLLELEWDGAVCGPSHDVRSARPPVLRW